jgi:hypothetical protein
MACLITEDLKGMSKPNFKIEGAQWRIEPEEIILFAFQQQPTNNRRFKCVLKISRKAVHRKGGRLAMFVPEGNVLTALKAAGLDTIIPMFQERDDAIAAVGP